MKNLFLLLVMFSFASFSLTGQNVKTFNYQGVLLDDEGKPLAGESVTVNVSVPMANFSGSASTTTSDLGAFSVDIPINEDADFSDEQNYQLETSVSTSQGSVSSSSPLSYAPIALFANEAESVKGVDNVIQTLSIDGNEISISEGNSIFIPTGGTDADADPENELQHLYVDSQSNSEVSIGLDVVNEEIVFSIEDGDADDQNEIQSWDEIPGIPAGIADGVDDVEDDDADPENEIQSWGEIPGIPAGIADGIDDVDDLDNDPENELQELVDLSDPGSTVQIGLTGVPGNIDLTNAVSSLSSGSSVWDEIGNDIYFQGGNVGIGLSNPDYILEVEGDVNLLNGLRLGEAQGPVEGMVQFEGGELQVYGNYCSINETDNFNGNAQSVFDCWSKIHRSDEGPWYVDGNDIYHLGGGNFNYRVGIGTFNPDSRLHVVGKSILEGELELGSENGNQFNAVDDFSVELNGSFASQFDNLDPLGNSSKRWTSLWASDGTINTSDRREKKDIAAINASLSKVMQLKPVDFRWNLDKSNSEKHLGFIAQDLLEVLPEVVVTHERKRTGEGPDEFEMIPAKRLGVKYADIIPVLTGAIQEQQAIIEDQQTEIDLLKKQVADILKILED